MLKPLMAVVPFALVLAASPALAQPAQFDLVCTGVVKVTAQPWTARLSVDLATAAYCWSPCQTPQPIARITPGWIDFGGEPVGFDVNRVTGNVSGHAGVGGETGDVTGKCVPSPFTPFPRNQF